MHRIVFTKRADKALKKMPRNWAKRVRQKLEQIAKEPYAQNNNVTKLQERPGYRLRVGDWRIIYEIEDDEVRILVLKIASRGNVYR